MYDHVSNTWTYMGSLNYGKYNHSLVAIKNKLFAFGERTKVFDMYNRMPKSFAVLKLPTPFLNTGSLMVTTAVKIGRNILISKRLSTTITIFDSDRNKWSEENSKATKEIKGFYCLKLSKI